MEPVTLALETIILSARSALADNTGTILIFGAVMVLAIYITALVLSKKTRCIIVWGWKDLIALALLSSTLFVIILIVMRALEVNYAAGEIGDICEISTIVVPVLGIVAAASFAWTLANSVFSNITNTPPVNIIYIVISVLTKMILLVVIPVLFFLYLGYNSNSGYKKDARTRDGTRGNQKTKSLAMFFLFVSLLFVPLVKKDSGR